MDALNRLNNRGKIALAIGIPLAIFIAIFIYTDSRKGRLHIISENGAVIMASLDPAQPLEQIGTSEVTIKTSSSERIYVLAEKDGRVTQGVYYLEPFERREETLVLEDLVTTEAVVGSPVANILIENDVVYGTDPIAQVLTVNPVDQSQVVADFELTSPVADVDWQNSRNFVADVFGQGVFLLRNGQVVRPGGGDGPFFQDYATRDPAREILLLNNQGELFTLDGIKDSSPTQVASTSANADSQMYSAGEYAAIVTPIYNDVESEAETIGGISNQNPRADELDGEGLIEFAPQQYNVIIADYDGSTVQEFSVASNDSFQTIVPFNDGYLALTNRDLFVIDENGNQSSELPLFFEDARDVITHEDNIILLNNAGLWRYDTSSMQIKLLSEYNDEEEYARQSLDVVGNSIVYSVSVIAEEKTDFSDPASLDFSRERAGEGESLDNGYVYRLELSNL